MYIEELVEVAVGLVLAWLVLALACMSVQEWLVGLAGIRAKYLRDAIKGMLEEPDKTKNIIGRIFRWLKRTFRWSIDANTLLVTDFFDHQLVRALSKSGTKPSYIPANTFALALFDVLATAGTDESFIKKSLKDWTERLTDNQIRKEAKDAIDKALPELIELVGAASGNPGYLAQLTKKLAELRARFPVIEPALEELAESTSLRRIVRGVANRAIDSPEAAQALNSLIAGANAYAKEGENALALARTNVETWFDETMDRVSGWYKRRRQFYAFFIGLLFAVLLNVDSIVITTRLWREPTLRQALIVQAEQFELPEQAQQRDPSSAISFFREELKGLDLPIGWVPLEIDQGEICRWNPQVKVAGTVPGIRIAGECIAPADVPEGIPLGWGYVLPKVLGMMISGLAAAQGAPFWFDVLKKLTNVRSAGKNPAETEKRKRTG